MRFWLDRGLDGFRCDAVPYLVEREGTNCENLPETHAILKEFRAVIDREYGGARLLLAEANQWPEDVRPYFGDGDEFHMAFNFPLMPRLYLGLRLEDSRPITDIFTQMPPIPARLSVGAVPAQPRRADAGDGDGRGAGLHVLCVRARARHEAQPRDPPSPGAADGRRPPPRRAPELPAAHPAREPHHLLRRRDRHGRQGVARRPQRRAHAHAVVARPQRGILERRARAVSTCRSSRIRSTATRR